jgi:hypothetical protein
MKTPYNDPNSTGAENCPCEFCSPAQAESDGSVFLIASAAIIFIIGVIAFLLLCGAAVQYATN